MHATLLSYLEFSTFGNNIKIHCCITQMAGGNLYSGKNVSSFNSILTFVKWR